MEVPTMSMTCTKINAKAITMPCPKCGNEEAGIAVLLHCLDDNDCQFRCGECEEEFGSNQIREFVRKWSKLLAWIDNAPDMDADADADAE
jgi:hypothetical protein